MGLFEGEVLRQIAVAKKEGVDLPHECRVGRTIPTHIPGPYTLGGIRKLFSFFLSSFLSFFLSLFVSFFVFVCVFVCFSSYIGFVCLSVGLFV